MLGQVRLGLIRIGSWMGLGILDWIRLGLISLGWVKLGYVMLC
jgi:hypothetical protein